MEIDVITQYILTIVPAFTAVVGMIVTLGVGIGKIKKANSETEKSVKNIDKRNSKLEEDTASSKTELQAIRSDIAEIKMKLRKISAKVEHKHIKDKED